MDYKAHWERIYSATEPTEVSWYQSRPTRSLELLGAVGVGPRSMIIDVGGGDSVLVDALVERRLGHVTVLDISGAALARAQTRLGARAGEVTWLEADVTRAELPPHAYDVWHDRATFHFLTELDDRERYVATAAAALRSQGTLIVATFAPRGPTRCSGLDVARYDPEGLAEEFGEEFTLLRGFGDVHRTPTGAEQSFTYAVFRRR
jgi:Methylase involved in ubiquinone/menaquinone biosynthesis